MLQMQF